MDNRNFSPARWATDGGEVPIKLGLYELSAESYENGCIPSNVGCRRQLGDRVFRLATTVADVAVGLLVARDDAFTDVTQTASILSAAAVAGDHQVTLTHASLLDIYKSTVTGHGVGRLRGGFLNVALGTGLSYMYCIKDNTAWAADEVTLTLYDPIETATPVASTVEVMGNMYHAVDKATTTAEAPCGVIMKASTAAADTTEYYQWVQTWGPCTVLAGAAIAVGKQLALDDSTAGRVYPSADSVENDIGFSMKAAGDDDSCIVYLQIAP